MKTERIDLTSTWQLIVDNSDSSGTGASSDVHFQITQGIGLFRYDDDTPVEQDGMKLAAETTLFYVPQGAKIYGKLEIEKDSCIVFVNK